MRLRAQLIPQRTRGSVTIVGSYRDRKTDKELFLLSSGKKVVSHLQENERVFQHSFESGYPLEMSFDESDFQERSVVEFWKNHPLVKTDGYTNPNLVSEAFSFEIKDEKIRVDYDVILSKLNCVSIVSTMTDKERRDLCFSLGSDPRGMTFKEVYIHLIGLRLEGIAIAKRESVFVYNQVRGVERIATIYANKALQYNVVKQEGVVYKVGGRNLGSSIDAVISAILSDGELFENYIKPEVDRLEKDELSQIETIGNESLELPAELENLIPAITGADKKKIPRVNAR
jgi:hypothetical protein